MADDSERQRKAQHPPSTVLSPALAKENPKAAGHNVRLQSGSASVTLLLRRA